MPGIRNTPGATGVGAVGAGAVGAGVVGAGVADAGGVGVDACGAGRWGETGVGPSMPGMRTGGGDCTAGSGAVTSFGAGFSSGSTEDPALLAINLASSAIRSSDLSWPSGICCGLAVIESSAPRTLQPGAWTAPAVTRPLYQPMRRNYESSSGAVTPSKPRPLTSTCRTAATRASRAIVSFESSALTNRKAAS
jgi:hypothetical protein